MFGETSQWFDRVHIPVSITAPQSTTASSSRGNQNARRLRWWNGADGGINMVAVRVVGPDDRDHTHYLTPLAAQD